MVRFSRILAFQSRTAGLLMVAEKFVGNFLPNLNHPAILLANSQTMNR